MTGVKISALPSASAIDGSEPLPIVQAGATKKVTGAQILAYVEENVGPGVTEATEIFTLSGTDITNKFVTLANTPIANANVRAFPKNNTQGVYGDDFQMISGNRLSWNALGWATKLIASDKLIVSYLY